MNKQKLNSLPMVYPLPSVLVGAMINGRPNYCTLGNCGIISVEPAVLYISSHKTNFTNTGIHQYGCFTVNIPSTNLMKELDYCGLCSGKEIDKAKIFKAYYGEDNNSPMIQECPINISCEVMKNITVYDMEVFIGKVTEVYASVDCLTDGFPDTKKVDPLIYCMDNKYWKIGDPIGYGFSEGKELL